MVLLISPALFSCRGGIILFVCRQPQLIHMVDKTATGIPADRRSCMCSLPLRGKGVRFLWFWRLQISSRLLSSEMAVVHICWIKNPTRRWKLSFLWTGAALYASYRLLLISNKLCKWGVKVMGGCGGSAVRKFFWAVKFCATVQSNNLRMDAMETSSERDVYRTQRDPLK